MATHMSPPASRSKRISRAGVDFSAPLPPATGPDPPVGSRCRASSPTGAPVPAPSRTRVGLGCAAGPSQLQGHEMSQRRAMPPRRLRQDLRPGTQAAGSRRPASLLAEEHGVDGRPASPPQPAASSMSVPRGLPSKEDMRLHAGPDPLERHRGRMGTGSHRHRLLPDPGLRHGGRAGWVNAPPSKPGVHEHLRGLCREVAGGDLVQDLDAGS